ncbi:serine/threonine-protein kinase [Streptomyces sp. NPDC005438]|uniref:serine/threonine-protein kinase n=1 Tax=Streptomyces sp. NPDC005438 TaxID=3156880 RepID=UPI0033A95C20
MAGMRLSALGDRDPRTLGRYQLHRRIASGGMGRVYLASSPREDHALIAVKTLRAEGEVSPHSRRRFAREVALARRLDSGYTARVRDSDARAAHPWMAVDFIPAPSLAELVRRTGPLPPRSVYWIAAGVAQALVALHREGVIHRDVKPQNVLLPLDGPRVIDFGISHARDHTRTATTLGTIEYTSPEQARGEGSTAASDVYSLGATLFHLAVGHPPYPEAEDAFQLLELVRHAETRLDALPGELDRLVRPCLRPDPERRPTPAALLEHCLGRLGGPAPDHRGRRWLPSRCTGLIREYGRQGQELRHAIRREEALRDGAEQPGPRRPLLLAGVGGVDSVVRSEAARLTTRFHGLLDPRGRRRREREAEEAERRRGEREQERQRLEAERRRQREEAERRRKEREARRKAAGQLKIVTAVVVLALVVGGLVLLDHKPWQGGTREPAAVPDNPTNTAPAEVSSGLTRGSPGGLTKDSDPSPDATHRAFQAIRAGDCLTAHKDGYGEWNHPVPTKVTCGASHAYVLVTSARNGSADCPSQRGRTSWRNISPEGSVTLCLTRQFRAGQCFLAGGESGRPGSADLLTVWDCQASEIPSEYAYVMRITGVVSADARSCPGDSGRTQYVWRVYQSGSKLCAEVA